MTTSIEKEYAQSTVNISNPMEYMKATTERQDLRIDTCASTQSVKSVSTSRVEGEVRLRIAPREMAIRTLNNSSR